MTTADIYAEAPSGLDYKPTSDLCWFVGSASPIDDEKKILARRWTSDLVFDVWVAVPVVILDD